jgi:RHS repeat-associated protein
LYSLFGANASFGGTTIYSISWTYDNVGNRGTQTKDGNQTSYTYNNMNQMSAAGNITFTYDSNGNTASKTENQATTNYTWNYENALSKIDNPSGDDYVYEYDGDGMRVRSGHDSGQGSVWDTRFYYDTAAPLYSYLFESDNDKNMTVAYTIDPDGNLLSQRRNNATYYHHFDDLGSTRLLTDASQGVTDTYDYFAFGEIQSSTGSTPNPFKFVGQLGYYDDPSTEFQYLRARYYAPAHGRFASVDPAAPWGDAYQYVLNSPAAYCDPSGLGKRACHFWCWVTWKVWCPHFGRGIGHDCEVGYKTCMDVCNKKYTPIEFDCPYPCYDGSPGMDKVRACQDCCSRELAKCDKKGEKWHPVCRRAYDNCWAKCEDVKPPWPPPLPPS